MTRRYYLCEWRSRIEDGETVYYPSVQDVIPDIGFRAVDLRVALGDTDAAYVLADTTDEEHAALTADPSVEGLYDAE